MPSARTWLRHALMLAVVGAWVLMPAATCEARSPLRTIDWLELMPEDERAALEQMAWIDHDADELPAALTSERTVEAMDGVHGRIAAFVVPIATDREGRVTEVFLVPYFGACIHVPPPPPNQIIYARPTEPLLDDGFWEPRWAVGTLQVSRTENEMATAVYRMRLEGLDEIDLDEFQGTE
jgi:uncharacterized protein